MEEKNNTGLSGAGVGKSAGVSSGTISSGKKKKSKSSKLGVILLAVVVFAAVAVVTVLILNRNKGEESDGNDVPISDTTADGIYATTEDEKKVTEEVLDKYIEFKIEGYEKVEDELGSNDSIAATLKNKSDKKISVAVEVVAKNKEGEILDKASLYAEGIEPGTTQHFNLFVLSELTAEQLQSADFEVLKAYTYETGTEEESETEEEKEPEQTEEQ